MSTKMELLALLEARRGAVISGQEVADALGVSRAAVWKAMETLRKEGQQVEAIPGSGYRLCPGSDVLSAQAVLAHLPEKDAAVRVLSETTSTNLEAKQWALEGAPHGAVVLAEQQSAGRGRRGRGFASPPGGLYMSMVLRPWFDVSDAMLVTAAAAVAVSRAVSRLCGIELDIKWVNDLFLKGRKCCGILSEAGTDFETGGVEYIVVGMGTNYTTKPEEFPPELRDVAISLYPEGRAPVPRAQLAAAIRQELLALFVGLPKRTFLPEYRSRSLAPGREVTVLAAEPYTARAVEINEDARLVVEKQDGSHVALAAGEISIRL